MKLLLYCLSALVIFGMACTHDDDQNIVDPLNVNQALFKSTLFIEVRDTDGLPVKGVRIRIGNFQRETDAEGFLFLHDIYVGKTTYITATHDHYFHASRKCYPAPGGTQYLKMILLPNDDVGFFSASQGTYFSLDDDASLALPANGYIYENGTPYDGVVLVAAQVIPSDDPDLSFKMPGDLLGRNLNGRTGALASMGMIAVELRSPEGELLQLKPGTPAQIKMKVGDEQLNTAPPTVPMWYFNEALGIWEEEGEATLEGNFYVGEVSHFSFWNYDVWFEVVKWGATFMFDDSIPVDQTLVCITIPELNTQRCEYTNEEGMVCGMVAANKVLSLDIINECGDVFSLGDFGPYTDSVFVSSIPVGHLFQVEHTTRVEGVAVDCESTPVIDLFAKIKVGDRVYFETVSSQDGAISLMFTNCQQQDLVVSLFSADGLAYNLAGSFSYAPVVNIDTLTLCNQLNEYVIIEYGVIPERIVLIDPSYQFGGDGHCFGASDNEQHWFHICMNQIAEGDYVKDEWGNVLLRPLDNVELGTRSLNITITYSGGKGDLLQGTFSGLLDSNHDLQYLIPVKGSFSVLRE